MPVSTNFTFDDVIQHVRMKLNDNAQRRWPDSDIMSFFVPAAYQQLRADRPDAFMGFTKFGTENFKPSQADPLPFADEVFTEFVDMVLASIQMQSAEAVNAGTAAQADGMAQRSRSQ